MGEKENFKWKGIGKEEEITLMEFRGGSGMKVRARNLREMSTSFWGRRKDTVVGCSSFLSLQGKSASGKGSQEGSQLCGKEIRLHILQGMGKKFKGGNQDLHLRGMPHSKTW